MTQAQSQAQKQHPIKVKEIILDLSKSPAGIPIPPDDRALAGWLGIHAGSLWHLAINRVNEYTVHSIPKANKKVRIIHAPSPRMKKIQKRILRHFLNKLPVKSHYGAYVPSRGIDYTVQRHAGHKCIIELDITNFFGSTTRKHVRQYLYGIGWAERPAKLLADILTYPIRNKFSVVPQGAPTSPAICNAIADELFDGKIITYLRSVDPSWIYTRYSDNVFISHPEAKGRDEVDAILSFVVRAMKDAGYKANQKKTRVMRYNHAKRAQSMLGLTVNVKPNIDKATYRRLRAIVHTARTKGLDQVHGLPPNVNGVEAHLRGVLNYYAHVAPTPKVLALKAEFESVCKSTSTIYTITNTDTAVDVAGVASVEPAAEKQSVILPRF